MGRRNGRREKEKNGEAAQNPLCNNRGEGTPAENPHPATLFGAPCPDREDDRQEASDLGDHAMGVLELHSANKLGDLVERAERSWPVGHGQSGVVAGDESSGDDQEKGPAGENDSKAVEAAIICGIGDGVQSRAPCEDIFFQLGLADFCKQSVPDERVF